MRHYNSSQHLEEDFLELLSTSDIFVSREYNIYE